eukprot:952187-Prymnesium_polylepis.1
MLQRCCSDRCLADEARLLHGSTRAAGKHEHAAEQHEEDRAAQRGALQHANQGIPRVPYEQPARDVAR